MRRISAFLLFVVSCSLTGCPDSTSLPPTTSGGGFPIQTQYSYLVNLVVRHYLCSSRSLHWIRHHCHDRAPEAYKRKVQRDERRKLRYRDGGHRVLLQPGPI
jgi:hypothetical protein